jgi:ketosteroid isomerase-like protein
MYAPDAEYIRADGYSKGPEAIVAYLQEIAEAFPDETATIETVLVSGDAVTVEWSESATHTAPRRTEQLGFIQPTGKAFVNQRVASVFRFTDGRIVSQHEYYDLLSMLRQLGWLGLLAGAGTANA